LDQQQQPLVLLSQQARAQLRVVSELQPAESAARSVELRVRSVERLAARPVEREPLPVARRLAQAQQRAGSVQRPGGLQAPWEARRLERVVQRVGLLAVSLVVQQVVSAARRARRVERLRRVVLERAAHRS
jgi:hypothetical protein